MISQQYSAKLERFQELFITTLLGDIPTIGLGPHLRRLLYRRIFASIGEKVYIQHGAEFICTAYIEIGNGVHIFKNVRLDAKGHPSNRIYLGNGVAIERNVDIGAMDHTCIYIDDNTFIAPNVCIAGPGDIRIGKQCMIGSHTGIYANSHIFADPLLPIRHQGVTCQGIVIEDDCWLGHGVTVLDGVHIGQGSVVGAGAVVNKDIPPYSVAVGTPARVIKNRNAKDLVEKIRV
ncbi:acyltransferase [Trichormus azollae]|jgi:galactoside O-acetyltransferase|uniref:Hexapaptide repeat-containing transferase n=1 Tax=Nostoc azollae (strain 0708) TaxID=551115 RepID=D7E572_NOSA0|nr:acyltransferase [Trichormus azollae]ADI63869.1 hexapaptide repeat-containing transferase ['Nostoc azollae' 0708]